MNSAYVGSGSGDETNSDPRKGKKQYHRHSAHQIQQLESFFREFPHPDENQRVQLGKELGLDPKQIKFWFQNKRTQKKGQNERADNNALRAENERLECENISMREALKNIICPSCHASIQHPPPNLLSLRNENSLLRQQHERTMSFLSNYTGNSPATLDSTYSYTPAGDSDINPVRSPYPWNGLQEMDKALIIETAMSAMDEVVELLRMNDPVWITSPADGRYMLHRDSYDKLFPKPTHFKSANARVESSKHSGEVAMSTPHLVEAFLDPDKWRDMFPTIVTKARTIQILDHAAVLLNGSLHLMYEKMHILSPLVAPREFFFIRFVQQHNAKTWVVVDVSYDFIKQVQDAAPTRSWKLPSGCMIEDISNGNSSITWMEHVQVDDKSLTHRLYRDLVCGCQAYGAKRWITTLQRTCQRVAACSMGLTITPKNNELEGVINSSEGRRNLMRLSHRMVKSLCEILSMSDRLDFPHLSELNNSGVRVSLRKSNGIGQPQGLIVTAATSLWLPFSTHNLFDFFKDDTKRAQWDILSSGNPVNAIARISTGTDPGNCISIIQPFVPKENILMLQESSIDSLGASIVYAPIDLPAITSVVNGDDTMRIPILPSGYVISCDGRSEKGSVEGNSGSLLTVAFQILGCCSSKSKQLNMESVATVHSLISSTVQKIKVALNCPDLD